MPENPDEIIVLTTVSNREQATEFGRSAVEKRVAACVTCLPAAFSFFRWESEAVREEPEIVLLIKTHRQKLVALEHHFAAAHPYEVPEFVVLRPEAVAQPYRAWLHSELQLGPA